MPTPASPDDALARYLDAWMNGGETTGTYWVAHPHTWGPINVTFATDGIRWTRFCTHRDCDGQQTRIGWPERLSQPRLTIEGERMEAGDGNGDDITAPIAWSELT